MSIREATHAGSWYSSSGPQLTAQLDNWLSQVPDDALSDGTLPLPGARAIISPHAGYSYSGACAAWAFKSLDLSKAKRIFILHPSHHHHLRSAALPVVSAYETPLSPSPLPLDLETIQHLSTLSATTGSNQKVGFSSMSQSVDEAEHSCEMQLPYLHRLLQRRYPERDASSYPPLVPIMVGGTNAATETALGRLLAPFIADPANAFVISSDFCHWGSRFQHTYYLPDAPSPAVTALSLPRGVTAAADDPAALLAAHESPTLAAGLDLRPGSKTPAKPRVFESIAHVDRACMCAVASGWSAAFRRALDETGNTVCGRHPIAVFMAGVEEVRARRGDGDGGGALEGMFRFVRYERSSDVVSPRDSSVSYVSAFAVL